MSMMSLLILLTISFQVKKMIWSLKYSLVHKFIFWISLYVIWMTDNKSKSCTISWGRGMLPLSLINGMWPLPTPSNQFQIVDFLMKLQPNTCFVAISIYVYMVPQIWWPSKRGWYNLSFNSFNNNMENLMEVSSKNYGESPKWRIITTYIG